MSESARRNDVDWFIHWYLHFRKHWCCWNSICSAWGEVPIKCEEGVLCCTRKRERDTEYYDLNRACCPEPMFWAEPWAYRAHLILYLLIQLRKKHCARTLICQRIQQADMASHALRNNLLACCGWCLVSRFQFFGFSVNCLRGLKFFPCSFVILSMKQFRASRLGPGALTFYSAINYCTSNEDELVSYMPLRPVLNMVSPPSTQNTLRFYYIHCYVRATLHYSPTLSIDSFLFKLWVEVYWTASIARGHVEIIHCSTLTAILKSIVSKNIRDSWIRILCLWMYRSGLGN